MEAFLWRAQEGADVREGVACLKGVGEEPEEVGVGDVEGGHVVVVGVLGGDLLSKYRDIVGLEGGGRQLLKDNLPKPRHCAKVAANGGGSKKGDETWDISV